ncbi:MAG: beta-ketoacyl-ACP synthase III [Armatimonadota bacterium]|nr:beta-ketoacyl-ACP synthase III [Armatimonadota bacterium]MDR7427091.1 beta-ketoacyl-ACP synthase III [Armatimonadota bacterium]MDR7465597.1 beta-ketoacyl-ACP synthase III [Armatimonadota bacterium]MDR7470039.1 beta-ketoacyl-ACP synthase III [Armatimonadota bacterium]MDR7474141.1 beta-ketoacyl-ACP synthase III [Armatimonadota bacterium]
MKAVRGSTIVGLGRAIPDRVLSNADLERMVDTTDEWIITRTGIRERRIASDEVATSDLAYEAAVEALEDARVEAADLDLIIVGTATPDMLFPATACLLQDRLGARHAGAFDASAACTSWVYGCAMAHGYIAAGMAETVLVVGAETLSRITNWKDRSTCVLFGDSAAAVVLRPAEPGQGFLSFMLGADGSGGPLLNMPAGGSRLPASFETVERGQHYIHMNGREVYKFAVRCIPRAIQAAAERAGLALDDVTCFIPHQANIRIIDAAAERLGQPREKFFVNVERYGNTSSASVPVALYEAFMAGRISPGDLLVLVAFGGGLTWGAAALRWTKPLRAAGGRSGTAASGAGGGSVP